MLKYLFYSELRKKILDLCWLHILWIWMVVKSMYRYNFFIPNISVQQFLLFHFVSDTEWSLKIWDQTEHYLFFFPN